MISREIGFMAQSCILWCKSHGRDVLIANARLDAAKE
jgi:hypothetical protein